MYYEINWIKSYFVNLNEWFDTIDIMYPIKSFHLNGNSYFKCVNVRFNIDFLFVRLSSGNKKLLGFNYLEDITLPILIGVSVC